MNATNSPLNEKDDENLKDINRVAFLIKKTEKLTSALYKVTDLVPDEEPLKWQLRNTSLELLVDVLGLSVGKERQSKRIFTDILYKINKMSSLLEVSLMGSIVSKMNFSILKDEFTSLKDIMIGVERSNNIPLRLGVPVEELENLKDNHKKTLNNREIIKDSYNGHINVKDMSLIKKPSGEGRVAVRAERKGKGNSDEKNKRRQMIIDIIKVNGEVSIKDIFLVPLVNKNYSEKTIQRELIDMVSQGMIKKKGERRWSRYYL